MTRNRNDVLYDFCVFRIKFYFYWGCAVIKTLLLGCALIMRCKEVVLTNFPTSNSLFSG